MEHLTFSSSEVAPDDDEAISDQEILESPAAESVLPYLTLENLSDHEKAEIVKLSGDAVSMALKRPTGISDLDDSFIFEFDDLFSEKIAETVGDGDVYRQHRVLTIKTQEARRLFCALLFQAYGERQDSRDDQIKIVSLFGMSPSLASYVGGLDGELELLDIAERTNSAECAECLSGEMVYNQAFSSGNDFEEALENVDPIRQLRLLPTIFRISEQCDTEDWNTSTLNKISEALNDLAEGDHTTQLVRIVAESMGRQIDERFTAEWVVIDMNNPEHVAIRENYEKLRAKHQAEQEAIREEFPELPNGGLVTIVAPGVAGAFSRSGRLNRIVTKDGRSASLLEYKKDNDFGMDFESCHLIEAAHDPGVKELIDERLGLNLADIPLGSQIQLLKFMTEAGNDRFDRLCNTLQGVDEKLRLKLATGFLAADFGEDFGDSLLDIANSERISGEQLEEILDKIESCRASIDKITSLYKDFDDGKFASEYSRAANERLTDIITVFREIANNGEAKAAPGWLGEVKFGYGEAIEALGYETKSLGIISGTLEDVSTGKEGAFAERVDSDPHYACSWYNFYSPDYGYVLLYTRARGARGGNTFDPTLEYGKTTGTNAGVEASINLMANPVDPFDLQSLLTPNHVRAQKNYALSNPYRPNGSGKKGDRYERVATNKVSAVRLDREGRTLDMAANDPGRSPTNPRGMVSVDLASIGDYGYTPSGKIARLISVGNALRAKNNGNNTSFNHNARWFDQDKYGTELGFYGLVGYVDSLASEWCEENPPGSDSDSAESFTKMKRDINRNRGRRTVGWGLGA